MIDTAQINFFTSSLFSIATAYSFYQVFSIQKQISEKKKLIRTIQNQQIKSPEELTNEDIGKKIIVCGKVQKNQDDPVNKQISKQSSYFRKDEFVLHFRFKEPVYSNDDFQDKAGYMVDTKRVFSTGKVSFNPNFLLSNERGQSVLVDKYDVNHSYLRVLEITKWDVNKRNTKFFEKIQILMYSYWRALGVLAFTDKRSSLIRGIHIGEREIECGIRVGSSIMALGTIGVTVDGKFFIEPQVLFRDRLSFAGYWQQIIESLEGNRNFWCLMSVVSLIYICRRAYRYNKAHGTIENIKKRLIDFGLSLKK